MMCSDCEQPWTVIEGLVNIRARKQTANSITKREDVLEGAPPALRICAKRVAQSEEPECRHLQC
jgi:hypothetical protein